MGTQDICLAVRRTEGADYSRWGSQPPSSDHPGHGTRPAGSFHASKLSADTSKPHGSFGGPTGGWGGRELAVRTSIKWHLHPEQQLPASTNLVGD